MGRRRARRPPWPMPRGVWRPARPSGAVPRSARATSLRTTASPSLGGLAQRPPSRGPCRRGRAPRAAQARISGGSAAPSSERPLSMPSSSGTPRVAAQRAVRVEQWRSSPLRSASRSSRRLSAVANRGSAARCGARPRRARASSRTSRDASSIAGSSACSAPGDAIAASACTTSGRAAPPSDARSSRRQRRHGRRAAQLPRQPDRTARRVRVPGPR